jgi:beta-phosphoglucomutase-like phosphatase (HAD superfamily)
MKIKFIVFDLDGVLLNSQTIHFEALNSALKKTSSNNFQISYHDHLEMFDGLSTKQK